MATFNLSNRILIVNKSPNVDFDYGPYDNIAAAMTAIPLALRTAGKTIGIISGGIVSEYWWKDNSTLSSNPILKISTSPESPITLGLIGTSLTSNADGATLTGNVLNLEPASNLFGGVITTTAQTFAGEKTFVKDLVVNALTVGKGGAIGNTAINNTAIGVDALKVNTANNNTAIGKNALANNVGGFQNTAIGVDALSSNVGEPSSLEPTIPYVGIYNTAVGFEALKLNISNNNTAVGIGTLSSNTTGFQNTAIGSEALKANTSGEENTAVGKDALRLNTDSNWNTAVGSSALQGNVGGFQNTAVGRYASLSNFSGAYNTSIGVDSLAANINSNYNTGLGYKAGYTVTGARNTFLGGQIDNITSSQLATVTDSIAIGYNAYTTKNFQVVLGNDQITETVLRSEVLINYGTPSSSGPASGLRVTVPLQTQTNISPDALLVRINGQTPTTTPGFIGGVVVEADGADNAPFFATMRTGSTSIYAGFVSRSEEANTTDLFQGAKLSGGVYSIPFRVEHTGDVTARKFIKSGGSSSEILMADGEVIVAGNNIDISNGVISSIGGGSGSSVNYYLNGGTNQGTFVGTTYYELSKTPVIGAGAGFQINTNGYIASFITDAADPSSLLIPAGNWNFEMWFSADANTGTPSFYVELYKYSIGGTFTLISTSSGAPEFITGGTVTDLYLTALSVPETVLAVDDRLAVRVFVNNSSRVITLHTENGNLCEVITSFAVGAADLGYTASPTNGTVTCSTGTDATIPLANATNAGLLKPAKFAVLEVTTNTNSGDNAVNSLYSGLATSKQDKLTGPGFVKANSGVITYDNSTYLTSAVITLSGGTTGLTPNTATSGAITLGGTLAIANGGTGAITAPSARTNLGATTIGSNIFTATNPSAITFLRANVDNTVSFLSATDFRIAIGAAGQITVGNISTVANLDGASITSSVLNLHAATSTSGGIVTSGSQTFAGVKTFADNIIVNGININKGSSNAVTNIAIGFQALDNSTGNQNTVVGYGAVSPAASSVSSFTTAVGHEALKDATGNNNTAIGNLAGSLIAGGFQNVFIGAAAGSLTGQLISAQNSIAIGYQAITDKNNQVVLGNSSIAETVLRGKIIIASPDTSGGPYDILTINGAGFIQKIASTGIQNKITVGSIDTVANSNGVSLSSGGSLTLHAATITTGGVITTGNQTFAGIKTFTSQIIINGPSNSVLTFNVSGANKADIACTSTHFQFSANNTDGYLFKNLAGNNALEITQSGNATFLGTVTAVGFFNSSDARLKDIIERDGDTVKFTWKDKRDDKIHIGYIAQEVQEKYPDQVNESTDGSLTVNYIEVLVAKIQELENRIKQLEK